MDALINAKQIKVTIASGGTASDAADLEGYQLVAVETPSAMTGTSLTFQAAGASGTYLTMYDTTNTALSVTIATSAARLYVLSPANFCGVRYVKVVSGSAEGAERTLYLWVRPV